MYVNYYSVPITKIIYFVQNELQTWVGNAPKLVSTFSLFDNELMLYTVPIPGQDSFDPNFSPSL